MKNNEQEKVDFSKLSEAFANKKMAKLSQMVLILKMKAL